MVEVKMLIKRTKRKAGMERNSNCKALHDESLEVPKGFLPERDQGEGGEWGKPCASAAGAHMRLNIGMERPTTGPPSLTTPPNSSPIPSLLFLVSFSNLLMFSRCAAVWLLRNKLGTVSYLPMPLLSLRLFSTFLFPARLLWWLLPLFSISHPPLPRCSLLPLLLQSKSTN